MPESLPKTPATLVAVTLLAMSGGLLDAVMYLRHGHVFANAMTGNVVLLGIAVLSHDSGEFLRHITPLVAFSIGVLLGKWLLRSHGASSLRIVLLLQMVVLGIAGGLPQQFPSYLLVAFVSLTGAMQITTIRSVGKIALNTTFMTGNLRSIFEGLFDAFFLPSSEAPERAGVRQFSVVGLALVGFLCGAMLGAAVVPRLQNRSIWIADLLLFGAGILLKFLSPSSVES